MKLPFTVEEFSRVFESYNTAIWPAQIAAYGLGVLAVVLALRGGASRSRAVSGILAAFWIWMGIAYHIVFFASINPPARLFGAFFVLQGILFAIVGCFGQRLRFDAPTRRSRLVGLIMVAYAMVIYPLIGQLLWHPYPKAPVFGVAPCPTTIFTFGLMLWASGPVPIYLLVVPLLWSAVGTTAAIGLQVPQDYGLGIAALLGAAMIVMNNRRRKSRES